MRKFKRCLALLLSVVMLMTVLPITALAKTSAPLKILTEEVAVGVWFEEYSYQIETNYDSGEVAFFVK